MLVDDRRDGANDGIPVVISLVGELVVVVT